MRIRPYCLRLPAGTVAVVLLITIVSIAPVRAANLDEAAVLGGQNLPDVVLHLVDAPDPAGAGKLLTYRISIENVGRATATNVTLATAVPVGTVFKTFRSPPEWQVTAPAPGETGNITAFLATLPAGPIFSLELTVGVSQDAVDGSTIENTASVAISQTDANPANNAESTSTQVKNRPPSIANVRVGLEAGPSPAALNGQILYTVVVGNVGPQAATDVVTIFPTPPGTTFSDVVASYGRCERPPDGSAGEVKCTVDAITPRRPLVLTIVVNVVAPAGFNIQGRVVAMTTSNDPDTGNNMMAVHTLVTDQNPSADISIAISGAPDPVIAGQIVDYTVTVRNDGPMPSRDTTAFFKIPNGGRFQNAATERGPLLTPPIGSPGPVGWKPGLLASGEIVTMTVSVLAFENGGTPFDASAKVIGGASDPNVDNNFARSMARVRSAGTVLVQWDPPNADAPDILPAPLNLVVSPTNVAMTGKTTAGTATKARDAAGDVLTYNVYVSSSPNVDPTDENLFTTVAANETTTTAPTAPGGSFFTITATYPDGDSDSSDVDGAGDTPGATVTKVKIKNGKLTLKGSGFTDEVEILFDGIPYAGAATVKKQNSKAVQTGLLVTGQTTEQYVATGTSFVIIVRNSDGGVTLVEYEP